MTGARLCDSSTFLLKTAGEEGSITEQAGLGCKDYWPSTGMNFHRTEWLFAVE